jgi:hypothetical protein
VVILFPDPWAEFQRDGAPPLVPGMFVRIEIEGKTFDNIYKIPRNIVYAGDIVYLDREDQLEIREVHVLRTVGNTAYVDKGINPGEQIITSPLPAATDGMKILTSTPEQKEQQ